MVIEKSIAPFWEWLLGSREFWEQLSKDETLQSSFLLHCGALVPWLITVAILAIAAILFGCLLQSMRYGLVEGVTRTFRIVGSGIVDLCCTSPRRTFAMAGLAIREAVRKRTLVAFVVFVILLLFAGWFLDPQNSEPAKQYLTFVFQTTSYLVLILVLFLSAFSLPQDLKSKTLHTVVTKPVRAGEIIIGRILGFTILGTGLLFVLAMVSYVFVIRGLEHSHEVVLDPVANPPVIRDDGTKVYTVESMSVDGLNMSRGGHQHRVTIYEYPDGNSVGEKEVGEVGAERSHRHKLTVSNGPDGTRHYRLEEPVDMLQARVPVYGKLGFLNAAGEPTEKGINVGDEWMYRSFITGGSEAAAIWTFDNVTPERFGDSLKLEMTFEIYRTYMGKDVTEGKDIRGVAGSLSVRNPQSGRTVELVSSFESKDFTTQSRTIPRKLHDLQNPDNPEVDLYNDIVHDGKLEVILKCLDPNQYFGAAQADLYIRARDASFTLNFLKGYLGIWFQMLLIIGFGVMLSTFLSGPVAMLGTVAALIGGFCSKHIHELAVGKKYGGGPFESMYRLWTQDNMMTELDPGIRTTLLKASDKVAALFMGAMASILPPLGEFSYADQVAYGFDIGWDPYVAVPLVRTLGYLIPLIVAGYFFLRTREVAK